LDVMIFGILELWKSSNIFGQKQIFLGGSQ